MLKLNLFILFLISAFVISCEIPENTASQQSSIVESEKNLNTQMIEPVEKQNIEDLFDQSAVYDVKYTYTVKSCEGLHSEKFNDLTFEVLGQVVVLNQEHMIMTRQKTACPQKVGVYAHWNPVNDTLQDIQGDFLIGDVQDWSESYGRINISGGNSNIGIGLSGYVRNIKIVHKETTCTIDDLTIDHGLKVENIKIQNVLCEELQEELAQIISTSTSEVL